MMRTGQTCALADLRLRYRVTANPSNIIRTTRIQRSVDNPAPWRNSTQQTGSSERWHGTADVRLID